jgi:hypothetical protein
MDFAETIEVVIQITTVLIGGDLIKRDPVTLGISLAQILR